MASTAAAAPRPLALGALWVRALLIATGLSLAAILTRLPFAGRYLFNWDAIQFALGIQRFDIAEHRPHPRATSGTSRSEGY